ncbi:hypothetical protein TNCV_1013741 [Trichonephila clavipes]|uniref:Uncharacterized protein n=1 Tax=Trichonephila clavipes TaxID=2585209 RepID=A0A8X6VXP5_TRICX|nr:hypothetical protein TNCV_1013741 [Trichonephila clavipes]
MVKSATRGKFYSYVGRVRNRCLHLATGRTRDDIKRRIWQGQRRKRSERWIPSHVNIAGKEIGDSIARAGTGETTTSAAPLIYLEVFSKYKAKNKAI